jgi:hypothetical protein
MGDFLFLYNPASIVYNFEDFIRSIEPFKMKYWILDLYCSLFPIPELAGIGLRIVRS